MKYSFFLFILLGCITAQVSAQHPLLKIDFENQKAIRTAAGITGKAFDLGNVDRRVALEVKNPLKNKDKFTIAVWVKGDTQASASYDILSSVTKVKQGDKGWKYRIMNGKVMPEKSYQGWKISMQPNGAWQFTMRSDSYMYEYAPMPFRQNIRDGKWHLLAFSYDKEAEELRFYYDGKQKAIYNVDRLGDMVMADSVVIGNSADSEHDFRKDEWDSFYGQIDDVTLYNRVLSAGEIAAYYRHITGALPAAGEEYRLKELKVTAFNIFHGGNMTGKEAGRNRIIEFLKHNDADIFTLVETYGSGEEIADALNYHFYLISSNLSIMSRYPITETYRIFRSFNSGGAQAALPDGQKVNVFAVWLKHLPEYRMRFMKPGVNVNEYLAEENKTRGTEMNTILQQIQTHLADADEIPVIIGGDFNSGSHLDWNKTAASLHNNYIIPFPVSKAAAEAGLTDSYRKVYPDALKFPGITWSPMHKGDTYIKDRIDYIYYKGKKLKPVSSTVIEHHPIAFPSDHAGVSTLFKWETNFN